MRLALTALTAFAVALGAGPPARAAIAWSPCAKAGFSCGAVTVPLDRAGAVGGALTLRAERRLATGGAARNAIVALAGGPGQAVLPADEDLAKLLAPALAARDLLLFDQRGTGASQRLRCRALDRSSGSVLDAVRDCANELGPVRGHYLTSDSVADLEDLRAAAGYDRLALVGVSYGTKVALAYAAAHPDRVESLVLDSVVAPEGPDVLNRASLQATGRVLRDLCAAGACQGVSARPLHDLRALVRRTARRPLRGTVSGPEGRRIGARLNPYVLFRVLASGDVNPAARAELPGAMRSAVHGDAAALLRLAAAGAGLSDAQLDDESISPALFLATRCEESAFPWNRAATPGTRLEQATAAARAIPRAQLGPFTWGVAIDSEAIPICLAWPNATLAPTAPGPLPAVRTLVLSGRGDVRTPLEDAQRVAARIPGATVLAVPFTGHSVLGSDLSRCARTALARFFAAQAVEDCGAISPRFRPVPPAPRQLGALPGATLARRTLNAALATVADVRRELTVDALSAGATPGPGAQAGGLRGGFTLVTRAGLRLRRVVFVPGVTVSGLVARHTSSRLTVTGSAAARGTLRISAGGRVSGVLGGRRVHGRAAVAVAAAARPLPAPSLVAP